jgi:hypothetical protein
MPVDDLLAELKTADARRQNALIKQLGAAEDARAVPALSDIVRDRQRNIHVRRLAAQALGQIGDTRGCMALIVVLSEPPRPDKRALPRLEALRKQLKALQAAADAAQQSQVERHLAEVTATIIHSGDTVRLLKLSAVQALGTIGYVLALKPLAEIIDTSKDAELVAAAEQALMQVREKSRVSSARPVETEAQKPPVKVRAETLTCARCGVTSATAKVVRCQYCRLPVCPDHSLTEVGLVFCSQTCLDSFASQPGNWEYWV